MDMTSLEEKIRNVLSEAYPDTTFDFIAIIELEDNGGRWDLAVSAPWVEEIDFIKIVAPRLSNVLSKPELISLGSMVAFDPKGDFMSEFNRRIGPITEDRDLFNITIAGISVRHAHVFGPQMSLAHA